jgi:quinohemoprotein ethanol dehydrogenase
MSFDPQTGLVYIPYMQLSMRYSKHAGTSADLGGTEMTLDTTDPQDGKGALVAYDPVHQRMSWTVQHDHFWNGGVLSTAGGLVFQGTAEGILSAYDSRSGRRLWQFDAGLGMIAAPISYSVDGTQYVSILTGYGASNMLGNTMNVGWKFNRQPRRLLTLRLDGHAALSPSPPPSLAIQPLDDPSLQLDPADVAAGENLFTGHCASCHGLNVVSAGAPAPDLRESHLALDPGAFSKVIHDGALLPEGMPLFDDLSETQVNQLYIYVRAKAREAMAAGTKAPEGR